MRTMGELEAVVMQILWSAENPTTVREVLAKIDRHPPLAYTTVLTVMDNLHRKGFLTTRASWKGPRILAGEGASGLHRGPHG